MITYSHSQKLKNNLVVNNKWLEIIEREINLWCKTDGFYEWYDIQEGQGYGSDDQPWSAGMFIRVIHAYLNMM
jgi:hypothetical protein